MRTFLPFVGLFLLARGHVWNDTTVLLQLSSQDVDEDLSVGVRNARTMFKVLRAARSKGGGFFSGLRSNPKAFKGWKGLMNKLSKESPSLKNVRRDMKALGRVGRNFVKRHGEDLLDSAGETVDDELERIQKGDQFRWSYTFGNLAINSAVNVGNSKLKKNVDRRLSRTFAVLDSVTDLDVREKVHEHMDEMADHVKDALKKRLTKQEEKELQLPNLNFLAMNAPLITGPTLSAIVQETMGGLEEPLKGKLFDLKVVTAERPVVQDAQQAVYMAPPLWHEIPGNYMKFAESENFPTDDNAAKRYCHIEHGGVATHDEKHCYYSFQLYLCPTEEECEKVLNNIILLLISETPVATEEEKEKLKNDHKADELAKQDEKEWREMVDQSCVNFKVGYGPDCAPEQSMDGIKYCLYYDYDKGDCMEMINKRANDYLDTSSPYIVDALKIYQAKFVKAGMDMFGEEITN